jgi:Family of unknown function (DUF6527)
MKKLTDLNPKWLGQLRPNSGEGVAFDCPKCGEKHRLVAYFDNPIDGREAAGWGDKWHREGEEFETLTVSPSIQYLCFHGWVEDGKVIDISESPATATLMTAQGLRLIALSPKQFAALGQ